MNPAIAQNDNEDLRKSEPIKTTHSRMYNIRPCPSCGDRLYGMPGGRDAVCHVCGFKDPCCSD